MNLIILMDTKVINAVNMWLRMKIVSPLELCRPVCDFSSFARPAWSMFIIRKSEEEKILFTMVQFLFPFEDAWFQLKIKMNGKYENHESRDIFTSVTRRNQAILHVREFRMRKQNGAAFRVCLSGLLMRERVFLWDKQILH